MMQSFQSRIIALVIRYLVEELHIVTTSDYILNRLEFKRKLQSLDRVSLRKIVKWISIKINIT